MKKTIVFLLCFLLCLPILSCDANVNHGSGRIQNILDYDENTDFSLSRRSAYVYENEYYYLRGGILYACNLYDMEDFDAYSHPVCTVPECSHDSSDCSAFFYASFRLLEGLFCVFEEDGIPYFYIADEIERSETPYQIERYNLLTGKREIMISDIAGEIQSFLVTKDHIFYSEGTFNSSGMKPSNEKTLLHSYDRVKKTDVSCKHTEKNLFPIGYTEGLYYYHSDDGVVYESAPDFSSERTVTDSGKLPTGYMISGGYLYYPDNLRSATYTGKDCDCVSYFRVPIGKTPARQREVVAVDVSVGKKFILTGARIFHNTLYYLPAVPQDDSSSLDLHGGCVNAVFLDGALEAETVCEDIGYFVEDLIYADANFLVFSSMASGYRTDIPYDPFGAVFSYDINNDVTDRIRYFGVES